MTASWSASSYLVARDLEGVVGGLVSRLKLCTAAWRAGAGRMARRCSCRYKHALCRMGVDASVVFRRCQLTVLKSVRFGIQYCERLARASLFSLTCCADWSSLSLPFSILVPDTLQTVVATLTIGKRSGSGLLSPSLSTRIISSAEWGQPRIHHQLLGPDDHGRY